MNFKSVLLALLGFILLASAFLFWQTQTVRIAPPVTFKTIKGESFALPAQQGKPILVTFWATDCPACVEEIPHLISLHQQYATRGLLIIAVAMHYDPPNRVLAMAETKQLPYPIALDPGGELARAFGNVQLTPTTFLIDPNGRVVLQKIGSFSLDDMQNRLEKMFQLPTSTGEIHSSTQRV